MVKIEITDKVQAVQMFHMFGSVFSLRYKTPSRIPPRMKAALDELCTEGVLERLDADPGWSYSVKNNPLLKASYPKLTLKDMDAIKDPLPIYGEGHI